MKCEVPTWAPKNNKAGKENRAMKVHLERGWPENASLMRWHLSRTEGNEGTSQASGLRASQAKQNSQGKDSEAGMCWKESRISKDARGWHGGRVGASGRMKSERQQGARSCGALQTKVKTWNFSWRSRKSLKDFKERSNKI